MATVVVEGHVHRASRIGCEADAHQVVVTEVDVRGAVGVEHGIVGRVGIVGAVGDEHAVEVLIVSVARRHLPKEVGREAGIGRDVYLLRHDPASRRVGIGLQVEVPLGFVLRHVVGYGVIELAALGEVPAHGAVGEGLAPRQGEGRGAVGNMYGPPGGVAAIGIGSHDRDGIFRAGDAGRIGRPGAVACGVGNEGAAYHGAPGVGQAGSRATAQGGDEEGGAVGRGLGLAGQVDHRQGVVVDAYAVYVRAAGKDAAVVHQPHTDGLAGIGCQGHGAPYHAIGCVVGRIDGVGRRVGLNDGHQAVGVFQPEREVVLNHSGQGYGRGEHVVPLRGGYHHVVLQRVATVLLDKAVAVARGGMGVAINLPASIVSGRAAHALEVLGPREGGDGVAGVDARHTLEADGTEGVAHHDRHGVAPSHGVDQVELARGVDDGGAEQRAVPGVGEQQVAAAREADAVVHRVAQRHGRRVDGQGALRHAVALDGELAQGEERQVVIHILLGNTEGQVYRLAGIGREVDAHLLVADVGRGIHGVVLRQAVALAGAHHHTQRRGCAYAARAEGEVQPHGVGRQGHGRRDQHTAVGRHADSGRQGEAEPAEVRLGFVAQLPERRGVAQLRPAVVVSGQVLAPREQGHGVARRSLRHGGASGQQSDQHKSHHQCFFDHFQITSFYV